MKLDSALFVAASASKPTRHDSLALAAALLRL